MTRYRLDISYDGTNYFGWQVQPKHPTIQDVLQSAVENMTGQHVTVHGSGRTDQGVHARRQVAHTDIGNGPKARDLLNGINATLPSDIRITCAAEVGMEFHAQFSAREKEYRYFIRNSLIMPPFERCYRTHVRSPLDASLMARAASALVGANDFAAFTANPNRTVESTVRELLSLRVSKRGSLVVVRAVGRGFLYKMVRSLAGFLIRVGEGAAAPEEALAILQSRVRTARVPTAPPHGLFLWDVRY